MTIFSAYCRRKAAISLEEAASWWFYFDPDYYRFHLAEARTWLRWAWYWEARFS